MKTLSKKSLNVRLQQAIRTESEWQSSDPVLLKGEIAFSSDRNLYRVGNGTSKWSELSYNLANSLYGLTASIAELNYMNGVKSNVQTQLDSKAPLTHTHTEYVNQNAFSNVIVGSTTISSDSTTDTLTLVAGDNITLTPDATNDKITIAAKDTTYNEAGSSLGLVKSGGDVTISSGVITVNDDSHNHIISNVDGLQSALDGKVPATRTINGKALSANITLSASDVGADASGSASSALSSAKAYTDTHINNTNVHITSDERSKLSGVATGAEVNQNAFSNVKVGDTTITADSKTDTLTLVAGSNVTLTPDATNDKITITTKDTIYTHPTTSGNKHIPSGGSSGQILRWSADGTAVWGADNNTTYGAAGSSLGLVKSGGDVTISDGIITINDDSHNHTIANVDNLQSTLDSKVPTSRTVNGKALSSNITLSASDVGAANSNHTHSYAGSSSVGGVANESYTLTNGGTISTVVDLDAFLTASKMQYKTLGKISSGLSGEIIPNNDGGVLTIPWVNTSWGQQLFFDDSSYGIAVRYKNSGTWKPWVALLNSDNYKDYCTPANIGAATASHTHNYAGSSSAGGSATSAVKLDTSAGSATQPVYFSGGKPVACTYSLNKTVPSDAKFTDTTYSVATTSTNGLLSSTDKKRIDSVVGSYSLGSMSNKTIADLQTALDTWLASYYNIANASAYFTADSNWITGWNSGDTTKTISAGCQWVVSIIGTYSAKSYTQLRVSTYIDEQVVYICRSNGTWKPVRSTAFKKDLDTKQNTITGGASTITGSNLTASRTLISDSSGKVAVSSVTSTELGYLSGVTSAIQIQLDGKSSTSHTHSLLKYASSVSTDETINSFLEATTLKAAIWTSTSTPGVSNGIIISGGYTSTTYGFQLAIDDDPTYYMALRQKGTSGWNTWKRIPMGDGTGASGTWGIGITGNAATATTSTYSNYLNIMHGNEIRFNVSTKPSSAIDIHIGYAWSDGTKDAKINAYRFENGNTALTNVYASTFYGALSGNATTATKATQLATTRTLSISGTAGGTAPSFDGTSNVTLSMPTTISGFASITSTNLIASTTGEANIKVAHKTGHLYLWGNSSTGTRGLYDTVKKYIIQIDTDSGEVKFYGNADTATKLKTARTINGTSFDGSGNITTTNWGTSRTITIGSTGKSVNGSGNVSWTLAEIGAAASSHTHNYAGSSSAGGAATSANKLNTDAGGTTQPVYFSNGIPVKTTYTLGKSVPSDAVFTDTHYTSKNVVGSSTATSNTTTALTNGNVYLNSVENGVVTSAHKISGSGATTVTSDTSGNIVISSTNTTYSGAGSSLGLVKSGGDVTISSGVITVNDDSHNHVISNIDNLQTTLDSINTELDGSIKGLSVSGKVITYTKNDGTTGTITTQDTNTTYSAATTSTAGLMSASDKSKLDGIASGANAYTLPTASSTLGGVKTTSTVTSTSGLTACPIISGVPYYKDTNTTYSAATTSAAGLMSASDKSKLDGITSSADSVSFTQTATSGATIGSLSINGSSKTLYTPITTSLASTSAAG